jgi:hypothetical protein
LDKRFLLHRNTILAVYILMATVVSLHTVAISTPAFGFIKYTNYNNYVIFKYSFFHLLQGKDLYVLHLDEQWDLFKYSPTFALFMGLFAYLPDILGVFLWNMLNTLVLFAAIRLLPFNKKTGTLLLWFILWELITSVQSQQSNALLAGLMIAAYCLLERGSYAMAALWLVCASLIKVYGAVGFALFLFYPDKIKFVLYTILWTALLVLAPVVVTGPHSLWLQYQSWLSLLLADQASNYGWSVMGILQSWFGLGNLKNAVMIIGLLLFLTPFLRFRMYKNEAYRLLFVAAMLVWVIIFNHRAESPTYIIALCGIGLWFFARPRAPWRMTLAWFGLIATCAIHTDLVPLAIRSNFVFPYFIKAVPSIILWIVIFTELLCIKPTATINNTSPA